MLRRVPFADRFLTGSAGHGEAAYARGVRLKPFRVKLLIGVSADEARERIESAGRVARVAPVGGAVTADLRPGRITIWIDDDGKVAQAEPG